jgi:hypothetical protein
MAAKKKKPKKVLVPRTRASETLTEAGYWNWICTGLRSRSIYWKPINEVKKEARRKYEGSSAKQLWEYQCNICKQWKKGVDCQVDHKIEVGTFNKETAGEFIEKLFCEKDSLQLLCKDCHQAKTQAYMKAKRQ